jgi:HlyD family secretion protein
MTEPDKKRSKKRRRIRGLSIAVGILVVGLFVAAIVPKRLQVDMATVVRGDLLVTVDEDGQTRVKDRYVIDAPLDGHVGRIELRAGDPVGEGAVVARIVPLNPPLLDARTKAEARARLEAARAARSQAKAAISRAETAMQLASLEAERQAALGPSGATSIQAIEQAEFDLRGKREALTSARFAARVAEHEARVAEAALLRLGPQASGGDDQMDVVAPVAGQVLKVFRQSEGVVRSGAHLLEVGDPQALEIVVDVLTSDAVGIRRGAETIIDRWGGDKPLRAHVRTVEPSAFTRVSALGVDEQRVNVIIDLDDPPEVWSELGDGYRVEARIVVQEAKDVIKVDDSAVFRQGDGWAVYRVDGGRAVLTSIEIGARNGLEVEVVEGLDADTVVIMHPGDQVQDGRRVRPRKG